MIQGPEGTGKQELAMQMVSRLLCTEDDEFACGQCRSCTLFKGGAHPDCFLLEPEEGKHQIVIDQVRRMISSLSLTTSFSPRKISLLCPAEALNKNAANALLKSLEEPPGETVIILVAHDASRLPVTIRSRCQSINVAPPVPEEARDWLVENAGMSIETAEKALAAASGSPLRAQQLVADGQIDLHYTILKRLSQILSKPGVVSGVAGELADVGPNELWAWLSDSSAGALRAMLTGQYPDWLDQSLKLDRRSLALLQQSADRNRLLSKTPVRQDLLLQDWLIKWSQLLV